VVNKKISLVEDAGLKHNLVTTIPLTLLSFLKIRKNWEKETIAFLYLGIDKGYLVFARAGNWSFSREFLWGEEGFNEQQVLSEVIRSRHHLIKRIRGRDLDRIIVSGETGKGLHSVKENLGDNLKVKVELLEPS
jgi:Tfp pilus assembly PilM family ATPase